ncbi:MULTISPECIES: hypothetical protein [unclassified Pseudomonas]|uniref:acyl-CoA dehydrogenase family protein n=1 Tax=unclassified Pseudomonas TaxID=196821 RepID=UPI00244A7C57|nr:MULTISPECIES: hypothetical protein [unclassified Pseudomonas]MDH0304386.1 hypothetical protein [Pseudomonas sp. GD04091]MDH1987188.1 hypothetical protein [Pseudomonas sp. GD03689]
MNRIAFLPSQQPYDWLTSDLVTLIARPAESAEAARHKLAQLLARPELSGDTLLNDLPRLLDLHRVSAMHDVALASMLSIHFNLCMGTIKSQGSDSAYVGHLYAQLNEGKAIGVFLATELGYGNNLFSLESEAHYSPDTQTFVLTSPTTRSFKFMPNTTAGGLGKIAVVMARLLCNGCNHGVFPFLLPLHDHEGIRPGVRISPLGEKPGYHLDNAITSFHNVVLPFDALLQKGIARFTRAGDFDSLGRSRSQRFLLSMDRVQAGKMCMAAFSLAGTEAALRINLRYSQDRRSFGVRGSQRLLDYPTYRNPLICDIASTHVHNAWLDHFVAHFGDDAMAVMRREQLNELAMLKASSTWNNQRVLVRIRERCGAQGLFSVNRIIGYFQANNGAITAEGDNLVIMLKAARFFFGIGHSQQVSTSLPGSIESLLAPLNRCICALHDSHKQAADSPSHAEHLLLSASLLGIRLAALRFTEQRFDRVQLAMLELYLLDQLEHHCATLVGTGAATPAQAQGWLSHRRALLDEYGERILEMAQRSIPDRLMPQTPISSGDYIDHFARQHLR